MLANQWPRLVVTSTNGILGEQGRRIWSRQDPPRKAFPVGGHGLRATWMSRPCPTRLRMERHQRKVIELHPPARTRREQPPRKKKRFPITCSRSNAEEMGRSKAKGCCAQTVSELQSRRRDEGRRRPMVCGAHARKQNCCRQRGWCTSPNSPRRNRPITAQNASRLGPSVIPQGSSQEREGQGI